MSVGRRGPLSFLDTEWRTALWKRWVSSHLVPEAGAPPVQTSMTPGPFTTDEAQGKSATSAAGTLAEGNTPVASERAEVTPKRASAAHDEARRSERRADVRARFDALSERLQGLEDAIDVIARRLAHRTRRERRTDRRTAELVENISELVEAQASAIDGLGSAIERIERRLDRNAGREDGERRDSRAPKARNSEPPRSAHPTRADEGADFSLLREPVEDSDAAISGSSIRGSIGDMSLSTVLAMIEIERRSGRLKVQSEDGAIVAFELEEGSVVGSRVSENDIDAVESLREVLTWKNGRFWFRQNPSESMVSPPRSVNSLLLEATRQIDEAVRVG